MMLAVAQVPGRGILLSGRGFPVKRLPAPSGSKHIPVRGDPDTGPHAELKAPSLGKMVQEAAEPLIDLFHRAVGPDKEIHPGQVIEEGVSFPGPVDGPRLFSPEIKSPGDRRRGAKNFFKHPVQTPLLPF
jgi:hypothetical protein